MTTLLALALAAAAPTASPATCLLAVPARDQVLVYEVRGEPDPVRCPAGRLVPLALDSSDTDRVIETCGARRICGRTLEEVRIHGVVHYARLGTFRAVESPEEASRVPTVRPESEPIPLCADVRVGPGGADLYRFGEDGRFGSRLGGHERLAPGSRLGACWRMGAFVQVWRGQTTGLVPASGLEANCQDRSPAWFQLPGPFCRIPTWRGTTRRATWLYPFLGDGAEERAPVPEGSAVKIFGAFPGRDGGSTWLDVGHQGLRGLVPAEALRLSPLVGTRVPDAAALGCPSEAAVSLTTCPVAFRPERWLDFAVATALPGALALPPDTPVLVVDRSPGLLRVQSLGLEGTIGDERCLARTGESIPLHVEDEPQAGAFCKIEDVLAALPVGLPEGWLDGVSPEARRLGVRLRSLRRSESLLAERPTAFPLAAARPADLVYLAHVGAGRRVLRALVLGTAGALTPLERRASELDATSHGQPIATHEASVLPEPEIARARLAELLACPGTPCGTVDRDLLVAEALIALDLPSLGREVALDAVSSASRGPVRERAIGIYRLAARITESTPRALPALEPLCRAGGGAEAREACRLHALAALESGRMDIALSSGATLRSLGALDARSSALAGVLLLVGDLEAGRHDAGGAFLLADAVEEAKRSCPDCSELVFATKVQLAQAAYALGELEAAFEVLRRLPPGVLVAHLDLTLHTLAATDRHDEAYAVLESAGFGLRGGRRNAGLLLWAAQSLERLCHYEAAREIASAVDEHLSRLERGLAAGREAVALGPTPALLLNALEDAFARAGLVGGHLPLELESLLGCDGPCAPWRRSRDEARRFEALAATLRVVPSERLRSHARGVEDAAAARCVDGVGAGLASLGTQVDLLRQQRAFLDIDVQDHLEAEAELEVRVASHMAELGRDRFLEDLDLHRARRLPSWPDDVEGLPLPFDPGAEAGVALGDREPFRTCVEGSALLEGAGLLDAAFACLERAVGVGIGRRGLERLVRYLPVLELATADDLDHPVVAELPGALEDALRARAAASNAGTGSCCLAHRPAIEALAAGWR